MDYQLKHKLVAGLSKYLSGRHPLRGSQPKVLQDIVTGRGHGKLG